MFWSKYWKYNKGTVSGIQVQNTWYHEFHYLENLIRITVFWFSSGEGLHCGLLAYDAVAGGCQLPVSSQ